MNPVTVELGLKDAHADATRRQPKASPTSLIQAVRADRTLGMADPGAKSSNPVNYVLKRG